MFCDSPSEKMYSWQRNISVALNRTFSFLLASKWESYSVIHSVKYVRKVSQQPHTVDKTPVIVSHCARSTNSYKRKLPVKPQLVASLMCNTAKSPQWTNVFELNPQTLEVSRSAVTDIGHRRSSASLYCKHFLLCQAVLMTKPHLTMHSIVLSTDDLSVKLFTW